MTNFELLEKKLLETLGVSGMENARSSARQGGGHMDVIINGSMSPSTVSFLIEHAVGLKEFFKEAGMGVQMIEYGIVIGSLAFNISKWNTPEGREQIMKMCKKKKTLVRLTFMTYTFAQWRE
jgi:hypothetical protein